MNEKYQKIICIVLAVIMLSAPFICYGGVISMTVKKISPHLATKVGAYTKVPGVVNTVTSLGGTLSTVEFMLSGAAVAGIAGAVIGGGLGLALEYLAPAYFGLNGIAVVAGAAGAAGLTKTTLLEVPPGGSESTYYPPGGYPTQDVPMASGTYHTGYTADCAAAYAGLEAKYQSFWYKAGIGLKSQVGCVKTYMANVEADPSHRYTLLASCNNCEPPEESEFIPKARDYPLSDFENDLETALNVSDPYSPAASVANAALKIASDALNGNNKLANNDVAMRDINEHLLQGLDSDTVDILETQADEVGSNTSVPVPLTPENTYNGPTAADIAQAVADAISQAGLGDITNPAAIEAAIQAALASEGLTAADIAEHIWDAAPDSITDPTAGAGVTDETINNAANAIDSAIDQAAADIVDAIKNEDEGSNVVVPVDPEVLVPEKLSLTSVLNDFFSGLQSLPLVQTFQGMAITSGGSSTLCVDLPTQFGGSQCVNFSSYEGSLNSIGSILLSMTTIIMMVYLFRG